MGQMKDPVNLRGLLYKGPQLTVHNQGIGNSKLVAFCSNKKRMLSEALLIIAISTTASKATSEVEYTLDQATLT